MTDASPLATYRYTLTWQDALAYERLPRELPGLQKITLYLWLAIAGVLLIALPEEVVGSINTPRFWLTGAMLVIVQYGIFVGLRAIVRLNRARYRFATPAEVTLIRWSDRLAVTESGKARTIPFEEIAMLLPTANHLFMAVAGDLVIIPAAAFPDSGGVATLVEAIDAYMRERRHEDPPVDLAAPSA